MRSAEDPGVSIPGAKSGLWRKNGLRSLIKFFWLSLNLNFGSSQAKVNSSVPANQMSSPVPANQMSASSGSFP